MKANVINNLNDLAALLAGFKALSELRIGELLVDQGVIDNLQLRQVLREQKLLARRRFGQIVMDKDWASKEQVDMALALKLGIPVVKINSYTLSKDTLSTLPHDLVKNCHVVPLGEINGRLIVATDCPFDTELVSALRFNSKRPVDVVLASAREINVLLHRYLGGVHEGDALADLHLDEFDSDDEADGDDSEAEKKPVVQLLNNIIAQGVESGASDINLRPDLTGVGLYYRLDGKMVHIKELSKQLLSALVSRIKVMAKMDIAERRLPQDGHTILRLGEKNIDLRVSIVPTLRGESVVIRVLDKRACGLSLNELGIDDQGIAVLTEAIQRQQGMILVTGPTGAGKSTTLYSLIHQAKSDHRHILTIEDPVEYEIEGVEQVQVMAKRGFGFAAALRQFLRHDPDVIMVGEIRDSETAQIANKAALTGHIVLSTLHTRDAIGTVQRLYDMGVEPYLLASTVNCIVAQRLIRRVCPECRCVDRVPEALLSRLGVGAEVQFYRGMGCYHCHSTGYKGRVGVAEVLAVSPEFADLIARRAPRAEMIALAEQQGMRRLSSAALSQAIDGVTSVEDALSIRVD